MQRRIKKKWILRSKTDRRKNGHIYSKCQSKENKKWMMQKQRQAWRKVEGDNAVPGARKDGKYRKTRG